MTRQNSLTLVPGRSRAGADESVRAITPAKAVKTRRPRLPPSIAPKSTQPSATISALASGPTTSPPRWRPSRPRWTGDRLLTTRPFKSLVLWGRHPRISSTSLDDEFDRTGKIANQTSPSPSADHRYPSSRKASAPAITSKSVPSPYNRGRPEQAVGCSSSFTSATFPLVQVGGPRWM